MASLKIFRQATGAIIGKYIIKTEFLKLGFYIIKLYIRLVTKQRRIPMTVGIKNATKVHLKLPVSFLMVKSEVAQGQWNKENSITLRAVKMVQPFSKNKFLIIARLLISVNKEPPEYAKNISGRTISLAGSPKIKAIKITPSSPKILPNGSKNEAQMLSSVCPFIKMLALSQIINPAGIAAITALPKTNKVLSNTECIIVFKICGLR